MPSALKDHVLEEMRSAVGAWGLKAAPGVDPNANGGGVGGGRGGGLRGNANAVGEGGDSGRR